MKRFLILLLVLGSALSAKATITINIGGGMLYNADGSTPIAAGMLVQLVASTTDNIFSAPTPGSFTGNSSDDIVLASIVSDPGTFASALVLTYSGNFNAGDLLMLRWFPTISGTMIPPGPPAGSAYGQFRTDLVENNSTIAWVAPTDGSTNNLFFLTMALGGAEPESAGVANMTVTAIPEPTTFALVGLSVVGLAAYSRRRRS